MTNPIELLTKSLAQGSIFIAPTFRKSDNAPVYLICVEINEQLRPVAEVINDASAYYELTDEVH